MFGFESIESIGGLIAFFIRLLGFAILIRALLSWVVRDPSNPIVRALDTITEPILQPLRRIIPRTGMMDFTPMIAMILLFFIASRVAQLGF